MDALRSYLFSLVAACMIAALASVMVKGELPSKIVRLVGGVLVLLVALSPLLTIDTEKLAQALERICQASSFDTGAVAENSHTALAAHIKRTTETYIENKAAELGAAIQAEVTLDNGEYPVPNGVTIIGTLTSEQIIALRAYLTDSLAIAPENQEWRLYGTSE